MRDVMKISDLQDVPAFTPVTAESVWHEWWADTDVSAPDYRSGLARIAATDGIPLGLVTHIGRGYVGSVLLIENDLEARPQYTPWIAALWVEP